MVLPISVMPQEIVAEDADFVDLANLNYPSTGPKGMKTESMMLDWVAYFDPSPPSFSVQIESLVALWPTNTAQWVRVGKSNPSNVRPHIMVMGVPSQVYVSRTVADSIWMERSGAKQKWELDESGARNPNDSFILFTLHFIHFTNHDHELTHKRKRKKLKTSNESYLDKKKCPVQFVSFLLHVFFRLKIEKRCQRWPQTNLCWHHEDLCAEL